MLARAGFKLFYHVFENRMEVFACLSSSAASVPAATFVQNRLTQCPAHLRLVTLTHITQLTLLGPRRAARSTTALR